ncbi:MAG: bifunctional adenosylcobinamide kinase/adenosylcobinamide-phosphate guanylyltransferase [Acidimicrobiales bacterium]
MITFLVGGARSGKSTLAVELGVRHDGPVVFVATAEPFDDDLAARVAAHRAERPGWPTVEAPVDLAAAVDAAPADALVIVDCLTVWVGNLFHHLSAADERRAVYEAVEAALRRRTGPTVVVSNEVGLGLHPDTSLGREYRDELGRLNQRVAAAAHTALFLVAGRAVPLVDPWEVLR